MPFQAGSRWTRVLGYLLALYIINFIDRNNIGFAVIGGMNKDLHIGSAEAGLSGGIFYLGYILLQIPSGILVERYDAKTSSCCFPSPGASSPRRPAGAERHGTPDPPLPAGADRRRRMDHDPRRARPLVSGAERATANSIWLTCLPLSFIIMGPISSLLLSAFDWRALFIIEGVPCDRPRPALFPRSASRPEEPPGCRRRNAPVFSRDKPAPQPGPTQAVGLAAILDRRVLLMSATYCFWLVGAAGLFMWVPAIIKSLTNHGVVATGLLSTLPYVAAFVGLLVIGRLSDRTGQRARFVSLSLFGLGLFLLHFGARA